MKFTHTMLRISDLEQSLRFYRDCLGLAEVHRWAIEEAGSTVVIAAPPGDEGGALLLNYTRGYRPEGRGSGTFIHIAYTVNDIYVICKKVLDNGFIVGRPPRDARVAVVRSPDGVDVELIQQGRVLELQEPWLSMGDKGDYHQLNASIAARIRAERLKEPR